MCRQHHVFIAIKDQKSTSPKGYMPISFDDRGPSIIIQCIRSRSASGPSNDEGSL